jgi:hypothetical protein
MYTTRADEPGLYSFNEASITCAAVNIGGHADWRVPTKNELNVLFNNRAAIGGFDESGSPHFGWYWSSTIYDGEYGGWGQRFNDGKQSWYGRPLHSAVRCVRD